MKDEVIARVCRWFTVVILLLIVVGGIYWVWPKFMRGQGLRAQEADLDAKIMDVDSRIAETTELERRFETDQECVESIARENGLCKPGEVKFVIEDDGSDGGK